MNKRPSTVESLAQDLLAAGIVPGDTLLVHSSMKSLGPVEGGAESVFQALQNTVTENGLLIFPAFSYNIATNENPDWDVTETPACTGILPELFRQKKDVFRSLHPSHSLAVWGKEAESFTAGHERFETAFNRLSPWGKLLDRGGKILLIGVDLTVATFLHAVEEWSGVPVLSSKPVIRYIIDREGRRMTRTIYWHTGAHSEKFFRAEQILLDHGALTKCRIAEASCMLMDCRKTWECMEFLLRQKPDFFAWDTTCPANE